MLETVIRTTLIGLGATALIDAWALLLKRLFDMPSLDFRLVGRWVGHMRHGRFAHERIAAAPAVDGEQALGWAVHYATGVAFAAVLVGIAGPGWLARPEPAPALVFGLATVAIPFLVMQPALGMGFAASRSPRPSTARLRSLATHLIFGGGLYLGALVLSAGRAA
jgi:hypothetical protein